MLFACGFQLRGANSLPPNLRVLSLKSNNPYGLFEANLKKSLEMVGVTLVAKPQDAPITLQILQTTLFSLPSSVGTSSQATVYTVSYEVKMALIDHTGKILMGPRDVTSSSTMTVNAQQEINTTNQLDILSQQLQQDVITQIFAILTSEQARQALAHHEGTKITKVKKKSS